MGCSADEAGRQLAALDADRSRLSDHISISPWLTVAAGAALAWFVAEAATAHPGGDYRAGSGYLLACAALLIIAHLVKKETGVAFRRIGATGWVAVTVTLAWTLSMFSLALALVSTGHRFWTVVPTLLAWAAGSFGAAVLFRSCTEAVRRG